MNLSHSLPPPRSQAAHLWDSLWDEVWAEYDARRARAAAHPSAPPAPRVAPAQARPTAAAMANPLAAPTKARRRLGPALAGLCGLALLLVSATGYAAAPWQTVRELLAAAQQEDPAALLAHVDFAAVGADQAARLGGTARGAAAAPPGTEAFLGTLALDIAEGLARPDTLLAVLHAKLGAAGQGGWRVTEILPEGVTRLRVTLSGPAAETEQADFAPPSTVALTLALRDPWRLAWQVVAVEMY